MAELVAPGAWWLHGTRGSNVYLAEALDGTLAIIDTGFGGNGAAIVREIAEVAPGRTPALVLLTHRHFDHSGSATELRALTGAKIAAGAADCRPGADGMNTIATAVGPSHIARLVRGRLGRRHAVEATIVDLPLQGEFEVLPGIRAIPAPGHTAGSYCFLLERSGVSFVGDLVISHGGRLSRPLARSHEDRDAYERSLLAMSRVMAETGCPGHGIPAAGSFSAALAALAAAEPRGWSPVTAIRRAVKLHAFTLGMYRRRNGR